MAFINYPSPTPIFPVLRPLAWSVHKTPSFPSKVTKAVTGRECQVIRAVYPRWEFLLSYGTDAWLRDQTQNISPYEPLLGKTELEQISGLFLQCFGAYGEFYYTDPDDCSRTTNYGLADGVSTIYPLFYTWGDGPFTPGFKAPVGGIAAIDSVLFNTSLQDPSTYHMDATNTKLIFDAPPNKFQEVTIAMHFYFRCRFLADMQQYEQWAKNLWENKEVRFQSVKP